MSIERKPGCKLLEAEACPDHVHMLIEIPPKCSISEFMGYLKSKSTLITFERHANMKYKIGNRKSGQEDRMQIQWRIYTKPIAGRQTIRPNEHEGIYRPIYG